MSVGLKAEAIFLRALEALGFERTKGSGAWVGRKGDGRSESVLVEVKSTEKGSFSVELSTLRKAAREARQAGRTPALAVLFVDPTGRARQGGEWVMIPALDWQEMMEDRCETS